MVQSAPQVHRARLLTGEEVVLKVQRPGLRRLFDIDLKNLEKVGGGGGCLVVPCSSCAWWVAVGGCVGAG